MEGRVVALLLADVDHDGAQVVDEEESGDDAAAAAAAGAANYAFGDGARGGRGRGRSRTFFSQDKTEQSNTKLGLSLN